MTGVAVVAMLAAALGIGVAAIPGEHVAIDEPQYLLSAMSLAQDGDLDISDELAEQRWRSFTDAEPPPQTAVLAGGRQLSPHDPLLALLLAVPAAVGGWVAAKLALVLVAGALAATLVWTAVRRFNVPLPLAATGVAIATASAPLAVYGQQIYPELPAALACLLGVAALTGPTPAGLPRRSHLALLAIVVVALPWLSVKYAPVAVALAGLAVWRWWRAGRRADVITLAAGLVIAGAVYVAVHRVVWGGWTVYASGNHFQDVGEFAVLGVNPDYLERTWRLVGLLVDRDFGLAAWQPAWLLVIPALAVLAVRLRWGADERALPLLCLAVPLLAGWLVATFLALRMHGWWWPGRQTVVVLPLALLAILCLLAHSGTVLRVAAAVLGLVGVSTYAALLVDGWSGEIVWVNGYTHVDAPLYQALRPLLPAAGDHTGHLIWAGAFVILALALAWHVACRATAAAIRGGK